MSRITTRCLLVQPLKVRSILSTVSHVLHHFHFQCFHSTIHLRNGICSLLYPPLTSSIQHQLSYSLFQMSNTRCVIPTDPTPFLPNSQHQMYHLYRFHIWKPSFRNDQHLMCVLHKSKHLVTISTKCPTPGAFTTDPTPGNYLFKMPNT